MTEAGLKPRDAEMIAAFIDRRLSDRERREFLDRLDREPALYEVFVETVRHREATAGEPAPIVRRSRPEVVNDD